MRVVQLNTADVGAGAEQVARDLHVSLPKYGVESSFLVGRRCDRSGDAIPIRYHLPAERPASAILENLLSLQGVLYPSTLFLQRTRAIRDCDAVHLHNAHGEYLNIAAVALISRDKPFVWTLHDQWAFTGKCVYAYDCDRWERKCGGCPILTTPPRMRFDFTSVLLRYKRSVYAAANICVVCPSHWLANMVKRSHLAEFRIAHIPNGVDTAVFRPLAKEEARARAGLFDAKPCAVFVSADVRSDYKGFAHIEALAGKLKDLVYLNVVGRNDGPPVFADPSAGRESGFLASRLDLALQLAAADFSVMPSTAENHSLSALESMACGTPVVAFDSGGLPEQIIDGETGILIPPGHRAALLEAIRYMSEHRDICAAMGRRAAQVVATHFTRDEMARRYQLLYESEIERRRTERPAGQRLLP